jgi:hypothetical protein
MEHDLSLRRVERDAAVVCAAMAVAALVIQRGGTSGALGVVGGGALMAFSFRAIKGGVDALVRRLAPPVDGEAGPATPRASVAGPVGAFILRYAVIGLGAWLLLAVLRAHPVGLIAGVTAPVAAITCEAIRLQRRR